MRKSNANSIHKDFRGSSSKVDATLKMKGIYPCSK